MTTPEQFAVIQRDACLVHLRAVEQLVHDNVRPAPPAHLKGDAVATVAWYIDKVNKRLGAGGTKADNNRDRAERGRSAKVVESKHKLTPRQAWEIQQRYNPKRDPINGVTALAREYGVDTKVIYRIVKGEHGLCE